MINTATKMTTVAMFMSLIALSTGCKKDQPSSNSVQSTVQNNLQSGEWRVTRFIDSDNDETTRYVGYIFSFDAGYQLSVMSNQNSYQGSWSIGQDNSNDDSSNDLHFNLNVNTTGEFADINDDWHILTQTANKIELEDVSGGNGGTDYLTFERN